MALSQITAYNVGFGDCFLLKFINNEKPSFLLLDCGSKKLPEHTSWEMIADDICKQLNAECDSISFMLTHLHTDHYNGFKPVYDILNKNGIGLNAFYTGAIINATSFNEVFKKLPAVAFTQIGATSKPLQIDSTIKVLWPPAPIEETQFSNYFKKCIPDVDTELNNLKATYPNNSLLNYRNKFKCDHMNAMSIVFEVKGINGKNYLFTGDFDNLFTFTPSEHKITIDFLELIKNKIGNNKYKMVKMPHHGTENWPINLIEKDGYMLISWIEKKLSKKIWANWHADVKNYQNKVSINFPSNIQYTPYTNAFKITIDIETNGDYVNVSDKEDNYLFQCKF